jgi:hypothetical protein
MHTIAPYRYSSPLEFITRFNQGYLLSEDFMQVNTLVSTFSSSSASGSNELASDAFPNLMGGYKVTVDASAFPNSHIKRSANMGSSIILGQWDITITGSFYWSPANATPLATHTNNTFLFMGLHRTSVAGQPQNAAIGFHYNQNGAGIFVAKSGASSIILPTTNLLLPENTLHSFVLNISKTTPYAELFVNNAFVVSTTSANIPTYLATTHSMNVLFEVAKLTVDAVNAACTYTADSLNIRLQR